MVSSLKVLNKQQPLTPSDSTDLLRPVSPTNFQDGMLQEKGETLVMVQDEHQKQNGKFTHLSKLKKNALALLTCTKN